MLREVAIVNRRRLLLLPSLLCWLAACADAPPAPIAPAPRAQPLPAAADCTLDTALVPGIPGSPGHLIRSPRNPNGDSELSALMRQFIDDLYAARAAVEAGKPVAPMYPTHRRMRCSWFTKPEERNALYDGLAQGYLASVQAFDTAPSREAYNAIINNCVACHSVKCGGPLDYIDGMRWR